MCTEFTNFIRIKGLMDNTAEYLPRLLEWVGTKLFFGKQNWEAILFKVVQKILVLNIVYL